MDGVVGTWGKLEDIALLQSYLDGGGVTVDVERQAVYYGYMGDHRIFNTTLEGDMVRILDSKPDYFIEADIDHLVGLAESVDPSELTQKINNYAVTVSWVTTIEYTTLGLVYQQIVRRVARGDDPFEMYLEIWDTKGNKEASRVASPSELLYAEGDNLYFRVDISDEEDKYGVAVYTLAKTYTV